MPVHRRWLVLVFGLLAILCCAAFVAAIVPFNARGNRLWDLKLDAMADGSVTVEEFAAYEKLALQDTHFESTVLMLIAGGCVAVMFVLLPVWAYTEPTGAVDGGKKRVQK